MKTMFASALIALATITSAFASSNPTADPGKAMMKTAVFPGAEATKINVIVAKAAGQSARISIKDQQGRVLAEQFLPKKATAVRTKFDLSELQDGTYRVAISDGTREEVKSVTVQSQPSSATRIIALK